FRRRMEPDHGRKPYRYAARLPIVFPFLSAHKRGRIINIASLAAFASLFEVATHNSSKAGVLALTKSLAIECGKQGVNVNANVPGVFVTENVRKHAKRYGA